MLNDIVVGQSISHFQILQFLGEGGMGVVYKALDLSLNRTVALKFIQTGARTGPVEETRFLREAQAAASLNHPNITTVYEVGETAGRTYIAMEYLDGVTLRDRIRAKPLSLAEAMEIAVQLADGLEEAHAKGVIHRDIKSSNIMVTEKNRVKIMDFGLARLNDVSQTLTLAVMGTAAYMSPEQASGEAVDRRTDIWSLGVVLYEMLTGSLPFPGDKPQAVIHNILNKPPVPVAEKRSDVPEDVERILARCLEKKPDGRYASAEALKSDLVAFGRTISPELAALTLTRTLVQRPAKPRLRKAAIAAAAGAAALAAVLLVPESRRLIQSGLGIGVSRQIRLAIRPFEITGGQEEAQASLDGLFDTLIQNLTRLSRFEKTFGVVPPADVKLAGNPSAANLHKSLNVNRILSGRASLTGPKPALMIDLIDAENVTTVSSENIPLASVNDEELPATVTDLVIGWLGFRLSPEARRSLAAQTSCRPSTNPFYRQARGYLSRYESKEKLAIAVDQFKKVIELDPSCARAYAGWGEACLRLYKITNQPGLLTEALTAAQRAKELNPEGPEVHAALGIILREMGQSENSRQELDEARRLDPENAEVYRELGNTYIQLKQPEKAETAYKTAIDLDKDSWSGYSHLGVFYLTQTRDYAKAAENFQKVIDYTPDNTRGYDNLAAASFYLYDLPRAIQMEERAISIKPSPQGYNNLGTYYFFAGHYGEAAGAFEKALETANSNAGYKGNLADAYRYVPEFKDKAKSVYEEAVRLAEEGLDRNPKSWDLLRREAKFHAYLGYRQEALDEIRRARDLAPRNALVLESNVETYEVLGDREQALRSLEELIRAEGSLQMIVLSPDLAGLRKDPRYAALIKGVKGIPKPK